MASLPLQSVIQSLNMYLYNNKNNDKKNNNNNEQHKIIHVID
jgi:hypothetical protein